MSQDNTDTLAPLEVGRHCAALHSRVLSRLVTRLYNNKLADTGLRITQFSILNAIKAQPPESIFQLSEWLGMERTSLQRTVDKLIEKGLVESEPTGNIPGAVADGRGRSSLPPGTDTLAGSPGRL